MIAPSDCTAEATGKNAAPVVPMPSMPPKSKPGIIVLGLETRPNGAAGNEEYNDGLPTLTAETNAETPLAVLERSAAPCDAFPAPANWLKACGQPSALSNWSDLRPLRGARLEIGL